MRKIILAAIICFSLLIIPANTAQVHAASNSEEATTEFVYKSTKKTEINRGTGQSSTIKTGDAPNIGNWMMLLSGSALILFLMLLLRQREEQKRDSEL